MHRVIKFVKVANFQCTARKNIVMLIDNYSKLLLEKFEERLIFLLCI